MTATSWTKFIKFNPKRLQLKKATVAILVCGNQNKEKNKGQGFWQLDGAAASENILIAANALGLAAAILQAAGIDLSKDGAPCKRRPNPG